MRDLVTLNKYRNTKFERAIYGIDGDSNNGAFIVTCTLPPINQTLMVVASVGLGWEHVSVSHRRRIPKWSEMEFIKRLFFEDDETVMQLHVPPSEHINCHNNCLHLWRPMDGNIPRPPGYMVG